MKKQRVRATYELLISGVSRADIVHYGLENWGVMPRSIDYYIASANKIIMQEYQKAQSEILTGHVSINAKHYVSKQKQRKSNYVYLIGAPNGLVKIGITNNVQKRFKDINATSPVELYLVSSFSSSNAAKIEKELHLKFEGKRVKGEWFNIGQDDISWIKQRYKGLKQKTKRPSILNYKVNSCNLNDFTQAVIPIIIHKSHG